MHYMLDSISKGVMGRGYSADVNRGAIEHLILCLNNYDSERVRLTHIA
jgi:hypothetical protein